MRRCGRGVASAALAAAAFLSCSPASPATQVKESLESLARAGPLDVRAGEVSARLERIRFSDVTVSMDGPRALVVAMVEADGRVSAGGDASLAYVGREAFAMERRAASDWFAAEPLPALGGVLATLPGLEAELSAEARAPVHVIAWQMRVERDRGSVGADFEVRGRAEPRRMRARWDLVRHGDRWSRSGG